MSVNLVADVSEGVVASFVERWAALAAAERANYQLFLTELCDLIGVAKPEPTKADVSENAYVFERDVTFQNQDGTTSPGRIDLYKRSCFVLEAKRASQFPMRCLFTMFAEDVELIPLGCFTESLNSLKGDVCNFPDMVRDLWESMDKGTFWPILRKKLRRFNGGLFLLIITITS